MTTTNTPKRTMTAAQTAALTGKRVDLNKWIIPDGYALCAYTRKMLPECDLGVTFPHYAFPKTFLLEHGIYIEDADWLSAEGYDQIMQVLDGAGAMDFYRAQIERMGDMTALAEAAEAFMKNVKNADVLHDVSLSHAETSQDCEICHIAHNSFYDFNANTSSRFGADTVVALPTPLMAAAWTYANVDTHSPSTKEGSERARSTTETRPEQLGEDQYPGGTAGCVIFRRQEAGVQPEGSASLHLRHAEGTLPCGRGNTQRVYWRRVDERGRTSQRNTARLTTSNPNFKMETSHLIDTDRAARLRFETNTRSRFEAQNSYTSQYDGEKLMFGTAAVDVNKEWNRTQYTRKQSGMTREERRESYGSTGRNARPRKEQPVVGRMSDEKTHVWETVLNPIYKALDASLIGKAIYPDQPDAAPLYTVGEHLTISANGQDYRVTVSAAEHGWGFIRYTLALDDHDAELSNVLEASLVQVIKPAAQPVTAIVVYNPNAPVYRTTQRHADDVTANETALQKKIAPMRHAERDMRRATNWEFVMSTLACLLDDDHPAWAAVGY